MKENIIKHMNEHHKDMIVKLCKEFAALNCDDATLTDVSDEGLTIDCNKKSINVPFIEKTNENNYKEAIIGLYNSINSKNKFEKIQEDLIHFIDERHTLIISSILNEECISSYAPFIRKGEEIFIIISSVAPHYESLKQNPKISIMFLQDEKESASIFARVRASFNAISEFCEDENFRDKIFDNFKEILVNDSVIDHIRIMSDFYVVKLKIQSGRFVCGFGAAYDTQGLKILKQAGVLNPHKYKMQKHK